MDNLDTSQSIVESQSTITEKHQQWQQSNMTTHINGTKIRMVMNTIRGTHGTSRTRHATSITRTCIASTKCHNCNRQYANNPDCFWSTLSWANHDRTCTWRQCRTFNRFHRHHGRLWGSHARLPAMVCTRVSNTITISRQWTAITHSYQQWDQALWIEVGLHAQCWRTTNHHTIICVWRTSTHCSSFKAWGTRILLTFNEEQPVITHPKGFSTTLIKQ